jgi:hypothetical protein
MIHGGGEQRARFLSRQTTRGSGGEGGRGARGGGGGRDAWRGWRGRVAFGRVKSFALGSKVLSSKESVCFISGEHRIKRTWIPALVETPAPSRQTHREARARETVMWESATATLSDSAISGMEGSNRMSILCPRATRRRGKTTKRSERANARSSFSSWVEPPAQDTRTHSYRWISCLRDSVWIRST